MSAATPRDSHRAWLADTMRRLLEEKYGAGRVPGVRVISSHIRAANGGETISHGHIHNILKGEADNLTDRTRRLLAVYFGRQPADLLPPRDEPASGGTGPPDATGRPDPQTVQALAGRFATFAPEQIAAIRQAIEIVTGRPEPPDRD